MIFSSAILENLDMSKRNREFIKIPDIQMKSSAPVTEQQLNNTYGTYMQVPRL